jgi:hypothetical protein
MVLSCFNYAMLYLLFCRHITGQRFSYFPPAFCSVKEVVVITVKSQAAAQIQCLEPIL